MVSGTGCGRSTFSPRRCTPPRGTTTRPASVRRRDRRSSSVSPRRTRTDSSVVATTAVASLLRGAGPPACPAPVGGMFGCARSLAPQPLFLGELLFLGEQVPSEVRNRERDPAPRVVVALRDGDHLSVMLVAADRPDRRGKCGGAFAGPPNTGSAYVGRLAVLCPLSHQPGRVHAQRLLHRAAQGDRPPS